MRQFIIFSMLFLWPFWIFGQDKKQESNVFSSYKLGIYNTGLIEANIYIQDADSGVSFDSYLNNTMSDPNGFYYDFNLGYTFKFPLYIGGYMKFAGSNKPGVGAKIELPFEVKGNSISPYIVPFYNFNTGLFGTNVGISYGYSFFSIWLESDFYEKIGFDSFYSSFTFMVNKKMGIYFAFNLYRNGKSKYDPEYGVGVKFVP